MGVPETDLDKNLDLREPFAEVQLFGQTVQGSEESVDCNTCYSCDGNPCIKIID